ncbi:extracellular solute-binding protein [Streptomyces sp. H10-C2]|uniref:extracellular solute-binding protein n=1 Tax=unclassified Streptomyces TaxID=2593676 RepID=UPI0024B954B4|nr:MULTISPECIES: extracellular solute-binding protein [unclassified Streptomyces]MDJ0341467.1 extracellular solute-binding protein [Streptomyces sp. PH10-H1]MDJ0369124.1 extracellular solute-binding protein [Streptomyces sp. H10-C2]
MVAALAVTSLTACGSDSGDSKDTIKVAYQRSTDNKVRVMDDYLDLVKKQLEKANPKKTVKLLPIQAAENDYYTKIQQMMRSSKTAPDLVYEDTFLINSDIKAGYLRPIDDYLKDWPSWAQFIDTAKAAARAQDGRTYGVPDGTDTRGLWFNKEIFAKAGLPADWQPRSWNDILAAARTVKQKVPGVIPLNVYTGKGPGEAAVMQGFEMLVYGTGANPLYDPARKKWVTGGKGFKDALGFVRTVYAEKLGPDVSDALDPNVGTRVASEWLPKGKLAIDLDGSWMGNNWISTGGTPWPEWDKVLGQTAMPTQNGRPPGQVSMSGGWTWAIPSKSHNPSLAWEFIKVLQTKDNAAQYDIRAANIAVRKDVATDPAYLKSMPGIDFFTGLVQHTQYRPALPVYPQVSTAIGEAMEGVTTGDSSVDDAASRYDQRVGTIAAGAVTGSAG